MTEAPPAAGALEELHALLEAEQGLMAEALRGGDRDLPRLEVFAPLVAAGGRTRRDPSRYGVLIESILEGYLLHYARGRIVEHPDPDLRLLAGDHLYAFGLVRLASIGDLEAVEELADLISLCAQAHAPAQAGEETTEPWELTAALWALSVLAVADGRWSEHDGAKRLARGEGAAAAGKVLQTVRERARTLALAPSLEQALIAFQQTIERGLSTS
jgi:hypothetical protein